MGRAQAVHGGGRLAAVGSAELDPGAQSWDFRPAGGPSRQREPSGWPEEVGDRNWGRKNAALGSLGAVSPQACS